ncbi:tetratricopeptide repeat protein [Aphanothece sacrum]|uniref:Uncharacterized protein n=1 Tax=Aphanothece sacrum FPU1 TaxID=1920663 RepID=A0A401ILG0_APHSA|nr:tetratricopeptide repeat protein [Aphanothece sacrum]GBF82090.1 hypothetical protein AsFPU1_3516 [Aphanothece sacrum FPU1]GBF85024.1 hypothetical protein AsFPU3_2079 [Aphanothece sacrum FPU3]
MFKSTLTNVVSVNFPNQAQIEVHLTVDSTPSQQQKKLKTLSQYIQKYPSGWKKRLELADLLYALGDWDNAIKEYQTVLKRKPTLIEVWLKIGHIFHLRWATKEAIHSYESALALCSNDAIKEQIKGLIESCQGRYQAALKVIQVATTLNPDNAAHWFALGITYLRMESPGEALQTFEEFFKLKPNDIKGLYYSHDALLAMGKIETAQKKLAIALKLAPNHINVLERVIAHRLRQRLVTENEDKKTWLLIDQALKLAPDAVNIQALLAYYYLFRGEPTKGLTILQRLIKDHWNNPGGWYHYAHCLFYLDKRQEAATAILKAYQLYQKDWEINRTLCEMLPLVGKLEPLKPLVAEILENFPERWSVWATTGRVLVEHFQDIEQGSYLSAQAINLQPQLSDAWCHHGRVLTLGGKHREAIEVLEQGWQCLPEGESCLQSVLLAAQLGENYRNLGEKVHSRCWWDLTAYHAQKLMNFHPTFGDYWQNRAAQALEDNYKIKSVYFPSLNQFLA